MTPVPPMKQDVADQQQLVDQRSSSQVDDLLKTLRNEKEDARARIAAAEELGKIPISRESYEALSGVANNEYTHRPNVSNAARRAMDRLATRFWYTILDYQSHHKFKKGTLSETIFQLGFSVVLGILAIGLGLLFRTSDSALGHLLGSLLIIGSLLGIVVRTIQFFYDLLRPTKTATCPQCGAHYTDLYFNVNALACYTCKTLLRMNRSTPGKFTLSPCPYCGLSVAVAENYATFDCPNCGIARSASSSSSQKMKACENCGQSIPEEALFCRECKCVLIPPIFDFRYKGMNFRIDDGGWSHLDEYPYKYKTDWLMGKDREGLAYFARVVLQTIRQTLGKSNEEQLPALWLDLYLVLVFVHEALFDPQIQYHANDLMQDIDMVYADLLESQLKMVKGRSKFKRKELCAEEWYLSVRLKTGVNASGRANLWNDQIPTSLPDRSE